MRNATPQVLSARPNGRPGLLRMLQAGVILSDDATLMVEMLKENIRPVAGAVCSAVD
jgi:hypothetical protein